jgi:hypothetical protein
MTSNKLHTQLLNSYPNWSDFVKYQSPEQLIVNYDFVRSIWDVYETSPITLNLLTEVYPLKQTYAGYEYLDQWLRYLNDFLNISKGLQTQYIKQLSYMLYAKYNHFRLSDLKLLFNYILESRYGTFYGSIDSQRIVTSFFEYNRERGNEFEKIEEKKREEAKKAEKDLPYTPPDLSKYQNISKLNQFGVRAMAEDISNRKKI